MAVPRHVGQIGLQQVVERAVAGAGTIGVVALQALTSFSVAAFFGRGDGPREASTVGLGLAGGVLLAGAVALVLRHIDLATLTKDVTTNAVIGSVGAGPQV